MDVDELVERYPRLFHLTEAGSWPAIAAHGLLPAGEIVSTSALSPGEQAEILSPHDVLVVSTASLIAKHHDRIRLSAINSGSTLYPGAPERGPLTFRTIESYPYAELRRHRTPQTAVVELAVLDGVPDIADHVVSVQRR